MQDQANYQRKHEQAGIDCVNHAALSLSAFLEHERQRDQLVQLSGPL